MPTPPQATAKITSIPAEVALHRARPVDLELLAKLDVRMTLVLLCHLNIKALLFFILVSYIVVSGCITYLTDYVNQSWPEMAAKLPV